MIPNLLHSAADERPHVEESGRGDRRVDTRTEWKHDGIAASAQVLGAVGCMCSIKDVAQR